MTFQSFEGEMDWFWAPDNGGQALEDSANRAKAVTRGRQIGKGYGLEKCGSTLVQVNLIYGKNIK